MTPAEQLEAGQEAYALVKHVLRDDTAAFLALCETMDNPVAVMWTLARLVKLLLTAVAPDRAEQVLDAGIAQLMEARQKYEA